jgi:hypothetical protein
MELVSLLSNKLVEWGYVTTKRSVLNLWGAKDKAKWEIVLR